MPVVTIVLVKVVGEMLDCWMMIRWWWMHKVKDGKVHKVKDKVHKED